MDTLCRNENYKYPEVEPYRDDKDENLKRYLENKKNSFQLLQFERPWDLDTFDHSSHQLEHLKPPPFNSPPAVVKYLGTERKQPVFDRFLIEFEGKIVIKLLEERYYDKAAEFIIQHFSENPDSFFWSDDNWKTKWKDVDPKDILVTLCSLFDEGNALIAYDILNHKVYGVLLAKVHEIPEESNDLLVNPLPFCEKKFLKVMQNFWEERYLKVHLLLVDPKTPKNSKDVLKMALINGIVSWAKFCFPLSNVNSIVSIPESKRTIELYKYAGFGKVLGAVIMIKLLCCDSEGNNTHKYFGVFE